MAIAVADWRHERHDGRATAAVAVLLLLLLLLLLPTRTVSATAAACAAHGETGALSIEEALPLAVAFTNTTRDGLKAERGGAKQAPRAVGRERAARGQGQQVPAAREATQQRSELGDGLSLGGALRSVEGSAHLGDRARRGEWD